MRDLILRPAISSDIPMLMRLDHGYSSDRVWQMGIHQGMSGVDVTFRDVRLPRPMWVSYPRNAQELADEWNQRTALYVADLAGECVGYAGLIDGPAPYMGWITDLVVDLPHRRQGVATRLLGQARQWCRDHGYRCMVLEMQSKNYPAICLARKLGFQFTGYSDCYYPDQDIALFFTITLVTV